jgi:hypothetical protein
LVGSDVIKRLRRSLAEHQDLLSPDKAFLQNFAAILEALLTTTGAEPLATAASLDMLCRRSKCV